MKCQPSPDRKLYLANKKVEIEARAAAKNPPITPTQVSETSIKRSTEVTSARSNSANVPGDSFSKPNVMTQPGGEEYERTCMIGCNQTR